MAKDETKTVTDEAPKEGHFYLECKRCGLHKNKVQAGFAPPVQTEGTIRAAGGDATAEVPSTGPQAASGPLSGAMPTCDGCGGNKWVSVPVENRNGVLMPAVGAAIAPKGPLSAIGQLKAAGVKVVDELEAAEEKRKKNEEEERIAADKNEAARKAGENVRAEQAKQTAAQTTANAKAVEDASKKAADEAEAKAAKDAKAHPAETKK